MTVMPIKTCYFLLLSLFSSLIYADELIDLSAQQVVTMQQQDGALVVDIRTEPEWQQTGIIPDSHKLKFFNRDGKYDAEQWLTELTKLKASPDQAVILVCRSGNRSSRLGNFLTQQLGMKNIYHLSSGIQGWRQSGLRLDQGCPTQTACK